MDSSWQPYWNVQIVHDGNIEVPTEQKNTCINKTNEHKVKLANSISEDVSWWRKNNVSFIWSERVGNNWWRLDFLLIYTPERAQERLKQITV
jgi:hypothetical protein